MPSLSGVFSPQQFTDLGDPLIGGRVYTYAVGTTTHKTAFTDIDGAIPHTYTNDGIGGQYIALNARGELPQSLYLNGSYDLALKRSDGSTVWTRRADSADLQTLDLGAAAANNTDPLKGAKLIGYRGRTVADKLNDFLTPQDFGTTGTIDDTVTIQSAINALPVGGILDGLGKDYIVKTLNLKSFMTLQNFKFKTKAGAVPAEYWSPVTIGGNNSTVLLENIKCINVEVDGNRVNNNTGSVGFAEDGGKHGFRVVGNAKNIEFINCKAQYCGSYGFFFYRGLNTATIPFQDIPIIENVKLINCTSQYNKSHGGAADSINEFTIDGGTFTHNGLAYLTDPAGLTLGGAAYSNAFDFEGYGVGSFISNVLIRNCDMRHNASSSLLFVDPVLTSDTRFRIRDTIVIENIQADNGTHPARFNPNVAINITAPFANWTLGSIYKNVTIIGGNVLGEINYACVDDMRIECPQFVTRTILGEAAYANRVEVVTSSPLKYTNLAFADISYKKQVDYDTGSFVPVVTAGSGAITAYTATGSFVKLGKLCTVSITFAISNNGTGASFGVINGLPYSVNANGGSASLRIDGTTGNQCAAKVVGNSLNIWTYNNTYPFASGCNGSFSFSYIVN